MAVQSWHNKPQDITHVNGRDIARQSSAAKAGDGPPKIHPTMAERTNTSVGAPPRDNSPPDASNPLPTDHEKQHGMKTFPVPACHTGTPSRAARGIYDPANGGKVIDQATISGSTRLPAAVQED